MVIIDLFEAKGLDDRDQIETALIDAVNEAGATLPAHIHLHKFEDGGGISGVAVLAESHISGPHLAGEELLRLSTSSCAAMPSSRKALEVFKRAFEPGRLWSASIREAWFKLRLQRIEAAGVMLRPFFFGRTETPLSSPAEHCVSNARGRGPRCFSTNSSENTISVLRHRSIGNRLGPLPSHSLSLLLAGDDSGDIDWSGDALGLSWRD